MKNGAKHSPLADSRPLSPLTQGRFLHSPLHSFLSLFGKDDDGLQCYSRRRKNVGRKNGTKHSPWLTASRHLSTHAGPVAALATSLLSLSLSLRLRGWTARRIAEEENLSRKIGSRLLLAGSRPLSRLPHRRLLLDPSSSSSSRLGKMDTHARRISNERKTCFVKNRVQTCLR